MLGGHYRKSLITALLIASLPGIVTGLVLFVVIKQQIETELQQVHRSQLLRTVATMDDQFSYLEQSMAHWAFDPQFTDSLKNIDFTYGYQEVHDIYRTLLVVEGSNPLIERVELYLGEPRQLVFTKELYVELTDSEAAGYRELLTRGNSLFWTDSFALPGAEGNDADVALVHKIPGVGTKPFGALVMHLNKDRVLQLVETLTPYNQGTTFLFEENGDWLFTTTANNEPTELDRAILQEAFAQDEQAGTFLFDWKQNTYSVTHGSFSRVGASWHYASAAPLTSITAPVIFMSKLIMFTSAAMLLFAAAASWFASRKLYSPVAQLLRVVSGSKPDEKPYGNEFELIESRWHNLSRESQTLQRKLDSQLPQLREGFLLQLLHGNLDSYSEKELAERMEHFGRDAKRRRYCIVLIQLLGFSKLEGRFSKGDEGLVTFAAANMVEELIGGRGIQADVVNFHDLSVGVLIALPDWKTREQFDTEVYDVSEQLIAGIEGILRMQATILVSRTTDSIKAVPLLFEETKLALSFRKVNDGHQIIDIEKLEDAERDHSFDYPFDLEKQVMHAVRIGKGDEAAEAVRAFVRRLSETNANEAVMKQGTLHLLGSLMHVVLQSGLSTQQVYEGANLYEQLCGIREPDEIVGWFDRSVIAPFIRDLSKRQNMHMRQTIERAALLLRQRYKSDISLDSVADELKISPFILSKTFKDIVGINFIDYLTNIRLEKARELLRETDLKISEVAEEVGYQHSYFNRLFKKQEGVTPSQYREMSRSN